MKREKSVPTRGMVEEGRNRGVSEGDIRMLDWEKSSGRKWKRAKLCFFCPPSPGKYESHPQTTTQ